MKRILALAMSAALLSSSVTVTAAEESMTSKQIADYMMSTGEDGAPNWFNGAYYSNKYEDLKIAFTENEKELYNHSLRYGFCESRLVTPVLDVVKYRAFYPDLNNAFGDNWSLYIRHYFEYGINEGRNNFTDFDAKTYLSMYADLQNAFGTDLGLATRHYIEYGISEGREYKLPEPVYVETKSDNTVEEKFTGTIRVDVSERAYKIQTYENGVLISDTWYDASGAFRSKETYTYDANGALVSGQAIDAEGWLIECTYYAYDKQKTCTMYKPDGTKICYEEDNEQGQETLYILYQEDGVTEDRIDVSTYDENGKKLSEISTNWDGSYYVEVYTYDENGKKLSQTTTWSDGTYSECKYENGVIAWDKYLFADGSSCEITYQDDVRVYQVGIDADGNRYEIEYYEDGATCKKEIRYYTDGTKIIEERYENNNWKSCTWYDASGNKIREQFYDEEGNLTYDSYSGEVEE